MNLSQLSLDLKKQALRHLPCQGTFQCPIDGLEFHRIDDRVHPENCFYKPMIIIMLQGRKRVAIGNREYTYGQGQCLVSGVNVPATSCLVEGSPEKPAIAVSLDLDTNLLSRMLTEIPPVPSPLRESSESIAVDTAEGDILDAFSRLLRLLDKGSQIPAIAPIIIREIYARLIISPLGRNLRQFCTKGTRNNSIMRAVNWLKKNYSKPFKIEELAKYSHMAPTTFHRHFKAVTSVSPLQYQKRLRLYEGKHLMLFGNRTVAEAAYSVGYESPAQFSREYKRFFGVSPKKDAFLQ